MDLSETFLSEPTTRTDLTDWSSVTARCGTSTAFGFSSSTARTRPNWPGRRRSSGLGNSARTVIVPVLGSTPRSTSLNRPLYGKRVLSARSSSNSSSAATRSGRCPSASVRFLERVELAHVEVYPDGIGRGHGDEDGRVAPADEVADGVPLPAAEAVDGRTDGAVGEVELGLDERCARRLHGRQHHVDLGALGKLRVGKRRARRVHDRLSDSLGGDRRVEVLLGEGVFLDEGSEALDVLVGLDELRLRLNELRASSLRLHLLLGVHEVGLSLAQSRLGGLNGRLVGARVELEEDLAPLDRAPLHEEDLLERRLDAGRDVHGAMATVWATYSP